jgi:predicted MPP superfamily phosphohydrolase
VFVTGDFVARQAYMGVAEEFLRRLGEIAPVYGVTGNGEHWRGIPIDRLGEMLAATGGGLLRNTCVEREIDGVRVLIAGVSDPELGHAHLDEALPPDAAAPCRVLLSHSPVIWDEAARLAGDFDLVLCGHTHGGQARLPWIGPLDTHTKAPRQLISGLYELPADPASGRPRTLYGHSDVVNAKGELWAERRDTPLLCTNRGIGAAGLPLRFSCPPEVGVFRLSQGGPTEKATPGRR